MKKTLSIILSITLFFCVVTGLNLTVFAEDDLTTGFCGNDVTYSFDSSTGTLTLNGTGMTYNYDAMGENYKPSPFLRNKNIKNLVVKQGITSVGDDMLYGCENLETVSIEGSDGFFISEYAFANCTALKSVTIGKGLDIIYDNAFGGCYSLSNIKLPENAIKIMSRGYSCPFSDTAYYNTPSNWKDGVLYIGKHLVATNNNLVGKYSVIDGTLSIASYAFSGNMNLTDIDIPDTVEELGENTFRECIALKTVKLGKKIKTIKYGVFYNCKSSEKHEIPLSVLKLEAYSFSECATIKDVYYEGTHNDWLKISIMYGCNFEYENLHFKDASDKHIHNLVSVYSKKATCNKSGNNAYYKCSDCGKCFKDAAETQETTEADETIPATGNHILDEGTVTVKATPTSSGTKVYKCTVCGQTIKTETIAKTEKYNNTLTVKAKKPTVKYSKLKKKNQTLALKKAMTVSNAQGTVTYAKSSGNKKITINKKTGKITVKKGLKKGTYNVKIIVKAAGNASYKDAIKTVTITIKVK